MPRIVEKSNQDLTWLEIPFAVFVLHKCFLSLLSLVLLAYSLRIKRSPRDQINCDAIHEILAALE